MSPLEETHFSEREAATPARADQHDLQGQEATACRTLNPLSAPAAILYLRSLHIALAQKAGS